MTVQNAHPMSTELHVVTMHLSLLKEIVRIAESSILDLSQTVPFLALRPGLLSPFGSVE